MLKSTAEKRRRLAAVLRNVACGGLDEEMIGRILPRVSIHRQYAVSAFSDNRTFREAVARAQAGNILLTVVFSRGSRRLVAAVITPRKTCGSEKPRRAIYVYAPNRRARKGAKT
jgi:hypothetical protein